MNPPTLFKFDPKRGYSQCMACDKWRQSNSIFYHESKHWILCRADFVDYWENTDELSLDYRRFY